MMFDVIPAAMPNVREGKFRPLAVGSAQRITYVPELRDVPGMRELLPDSGIDMQSWTQSTRQPAHPRAASASCIAPSPRSSGRMSSGNA